MSQFVFADTETTGLDAKRERLLEIACIHVDGRHSTGKVLHEYVNPEKEVEEAAFRVHGISWESVKEKPLFGEIAEDVIAMLKGRTFVAHNANFDVSFINMEFQRAGFNFKIGKDCDVLDTLKLAKEIYPGQKNSLDVLCTRLSIDRSNRVLHGALLDTELLVQVYIAMTQRQERFSLAKTELKDSVVTIDYKTYEMLQEELSEHEVYIREIKE